MANDSLRDRILKFEATEEEVVAWYLRGVLERTGGNQSEAMRVLAIDRSTVRRRLGKLGIVGPPSSKTSIVGEDIVGEDLVGEDLVGEDVEQSTPRRARRA